MPVVIVALVSTNRELIDVCREVIRRFDEVHWRLLVGNQATQTSSADLYVWDYSEQSLPSFPATGHCRHLYLVNPTDVGRFLADFPDGEGKIMLKPLSHPVLRAYLSSVLALGPDPVRHRDSELDSAQPWLPAVNLKLQQYDHERTDFLAHAAHDLRTPLTALAGFSGLLAGQHLGTINTLQKEVLTRMEQSTKRLGRIADSLFRISLGQKLEDRPQRVPASIDDCLKQAIHESMPLLRTKRITLTASGLFDPDGPLLFDPLQVQQVLLNLLDNAIKAVPLDGSVDVRGYPYFWERRWLDMQGDMEERRAEHSQKANSYRVDVNDNGPGVPEDSLEEIFEKYSRRTGSGSYVGGGLGLAISKRILDLHNGRIWAERHERGALFSFVLPYEVRANG